MSINQIYGFFRQFKQKIWTWNRNYRNLIWMIVLHANWSCYQRSIILYELSCALTAFSDTLCANNSNFHFRQRRFLPSYTSRSHSYRHTDVYHTVTLSPSLLFFTIVRLFVCFLRLCCDSVTFLSSLFTDSTKKTTQKKKITNEMKRKKRSTHRHTNTLSFYLSPSRQKQLLCVLFFNIFISLSFLSRPNFRLFFFLLFTREIRKKIHLASIIHLKCVWKSLKNRMAISSTLRERKGVFISTPNGSIVLALNLCVCEWYIYYNTQFGTIYLYNEQKEQHVSNGFLLLLFFFSKWKWINSMSDSVWKAKAWVCECTRGFNLLFSFALSVTDF